jgi:Uma2 family endonuclease
MSTVAIPLPTPPATPLAVTPEQLLAMPDGDLYELVDGVLVELNTDMSSSYVAMRLGHLLSSFLGNPPRGWLMGADCGYQCFPHRPKLVRKPDVSFIRLGRFPEELAPAGYIRFPPDLAVEVLSPNDLSYDTDVKVSEYLGVGVPLVWVINPDQRRVLVYRAGGPIGGAFEDGELDGESVLPGFRCPVRELFIMPGAAEAAAP